MRTEVQSPAVTPTRRRRLPDELGVAGALLALIIVVSVVQPRFLDVNNLLNLVANNSIVAILAMGIVFLLATGEIDLSFGFILNLAAVSAGLLMIAGLPIPMAIAAGLLLGALLGALNGLLSVTFRLPLIIITLGTASMFQGLSLVINQSGSVVPPAEIRQTWFFQFFGGLTGFPIPPIILVLVTAFVVLSVLFKRTRFGYRVTALGSNPDAARLAGIPVSRVRVQTTALMGLIAGVGGVLFLGFRGAVDPTTGSGYLLPVIAAAIIGGNPLSGGSGTLVGALLGALVIAVIDTGIVFLGIDAVWSTFVTGTVIVVAVGIDQMIRFQRRRAEL
jgi:ribose transport system permease protein